MDYNRLAELLFPNIDKIPEYYEEKYPLRNLPEGAVVTRFAPSPTGYMHIGGVFATLVSERLAHQSKGILYLRIEDTDKKREIEGGVEEIVKSLQDFEIVFDEGPLNKSFPTGNYGPYKQSERAEIYQTYAKWLVKRDLAYPCFCTEDELNEIRNRQEEQKVLPGYYGEWAKYRNASFEEIEEKIRQGIPFVLRLKSPGNIDRRIKYTDIIKGEIEMPENIQDIVILKSDGIPTYHFAHAVDDHLMRTTHIIRGDEWLSSIPVHIQLFQVLGFKLPKYAHIPPIMKEEDGGRRKLSKRKDPEAAVKFYHEQGYPAICVIEYLLNIANSNFEDWRRANINEPYTSFKFSLKKMSVSGALFDLVKLTDVSKNIIALMTPEEVLDKTLEWSQQYDKALYEKLNSDREYAKAILSIDRGGAKPRKDIAKWSDVKEYIQYFYDDWFENTEYEFDEKIPQDERKAILKRYLEIFDYNDDNSIWFEKIRNLGEEFGYTKDMKAYKKNPEAFKGNVADISTLIRVAITGRKNTPDMYQIIKVMGNERVIKRLGLKVKN